MRRTELRLVATLLALAGLISCGDDDGSPMSPSDSPQVETNTVTITSSGVSPNNILIDAGTRVMFVNSDTRSHNMASDPHPDHTDCLPLNDIGFLAAGQSRETGVLSTVRTCGFHDHDNPNSLSLRGLITIR